MLVPKISLKLETNKVQKVFRIAAIASEGPGLRRTLVISDECHAKNVTFSTWLFNKPWSLAPMTASSRITPPSKETNVMQVNSVNFMSMTF